MKKTEQFSTSPLISDQLITTIFNPLNDLDKSLPERITQYILHGEELAVLADFDKLCQVPNNFTNIYELLQRPAELHNVDSYVKIHPPLQARVNFYKLWTDAYTPEQIIRFARVFATLFDHSSFIKHTSEQLPSWFICLLYDGLITTLSCPNWHKKEIVERKNWSAQQLHQFLEIEQAGLGEKLLFVIFDRQNVAADRFDFFRNFTRLNGLLTYIQERIELFKQLPSLGLAPVGQVEQLRYIQRYPEFQLQLVDFIAMQALNTCKQVSQLATGILFNLPHELIQLQLQHFLTSGSVNERANAAILLSRIISESTILQQALANETNKTVIAALESALLCLASANAAKQQADLVIPEFEPISDTPLPITALDILQQNFDESLIEYKKLMEDELEKNQKNNTSWQYHQESYKHLETVTLNSLDAIFDHINGKIDSTALLKKLGMRIDFRILFTKNRLANLPEFSLFHLFRIKKLIGPTDNINFFEKIYNNFEVVKNADLRQIADVMVKLDPNKKFVYTIALPFLNSDFFYEIYENEPHKLWPFFAENDFLLDQALGFAPFQIDPFFVRFIDKIITIKILKLFPTIPVKYVAYLFELALGESKQLRYVAQDALQRIPNIHHQVEQALSSSKQEVRIIAANWLAKLGQKSSHKALNDALKKEKHETLQAAILVALKKIGEDISQHLTPKKLLADAQKGLEGKVPTELDWFDFNLIPSLTWRNGKAVDPQIIQWWLCLAVKLNDPANALLAIYSRLLSIQSQQQLGEFILQRFIKQDTLNPTLEEALAVASLQADKRLQERILNYQNYPEFYRHYKDITYEQVFDEIKQETLATCSGSAIKTKGILALICGIEGRIAVSLLRTFMKNHYQRQAQIEAMLEALANSDDPLIIQLLLSLVSNYRIASIQKKVRYLVENIAKRSGWTIDELADRTIATAGLDDNGLLILDYGERTFTASLDNQFKWQLTNAEGKKIKALPEAGKNENPELVKEVKKQFSNSKKELNQLLTMQISRFYEAMCVQHQWRVEDWQQYLQSHPIMGRFIQRLVWLELDSNGQIVNSFRPTEDGNLITNQDEEISIDQHHFITVAHSVLLTSEDIAQWQAHLKDYKVISWFDQLSHPLPDMNKFENNIINDRYGWSMDSFTLRDILTELGYERESAQEGESFFCYHKYYSRLKIYIHIDFSGGMVPEENILAVLDRLYFSKTPGYHDGVIKLDNLPKVLLAESYANYMAVADASNGFDPNWQNKVIWDT